CSLPNSTYSVHPRILLCAVLCVAYNVNQANPDWLLLQLKFLRKLLVAFLIFFFKEFQQTMTLPDFLEQTAPGRKILLVCFQVVGKLADFFAQNGNLHFWRTRV